MSYPTHMGHVYYVTARSNSRTALLAGPFGSRQEGEALESAARLYVRTTFPNDMNAQFAAVGTTRVELRHGQRAPVGKANAALGYAVQP